MGDQRDKLKQPELKVREESTVTLSVEPEPDSGKDLPAYEPQPDSSFGADSPFAAEPERPKFKLHNRSFSSGMLRHRIMVSACLLFSVSFMALSVLDFGPLVKTRGHVNTSMQFVPDREIAELPLNTEYVDTQWVNGKYEPLDENLRRIREDSWNSDSKYGFADPHGKVVIPPTYGEVLRFEDGLAAFRTDAGKWGFIDGSGKVAIKPKFQQVLDAFHDGVAVVQDAEGYTTMIDKSGNVICRSNRSSLSRVANLYESYADRPWKNPAGDRVWFNRKGQTVDLSQYDHVERLALDINETSWGNRSIRRVGFEPRYAGQELIRTTKKGFFGLLDGDGNLIAEPVYENVGPMVNGYAPVKKDGKLGFIDRKGKLTLKTDLESITAFDDLMAGCDHQGQWHVIDRHGNPVDLKIEGVIDGPGEKWISDGLGAVIKDGKVGFVNVKGQFVIPPKFDFALPFNNGYAPVWDGNFWHFIDKNGTIANLPNFTRAAPFVNGLADATIPGPLHGIVESAMMRNRKEHMDSFRDGFTRRDDPFSGQRRSYDF